MQAFPSVGKRGFLELPVRRLQTAGTLTEAELAAVRGLQSARLRAPKGETLQLAEPGFHFLLDGWVCQVRELAPGRRQIFAFVLPGDPMRHSGSGQPDLAPFTYKALTPVTFIEAPNLLQSGGGAPFFPGIQKAVAAIEDQARLRLFDHVVRLGAQSAYDGMAHLLLELFDRQRDVGLAEGHRFAFPISQDRLGDMLGLSAMHVHRTLAKMKSDGHLVIGSGWLALPGREQLAAKVGYRLCEQA